MIDISKLISFFGAIVVPVWLLAMDRETAITLVAFAGAVALLLSLFLM